MTKQTLFCLKCNGMQLNEIKFNLVFFYPDKFNFASFVWLGASCVCVACSHWLSTTCKQSICRELTAPFHMPQDLGKPPSYQSVASSNVKSDGSYGFPLQSPSLKLCLAEQLVPDHRFWLMVGSSVDGNHEGTQLVNDTVRMQGSFPGTSREIWAIYHTHRHLFTHT